jgi:glycosyltransferase involved in cell wall biosynthesis
MPQTVSVIPHPVTVTTNPRFELEGASIVSFAVDRWDDVPRCRHHVMSRLAKSNKVLFVMPPRNLRQVFRHQPPGTAGVYRVSDNLFTYAPSRWLPKISSTRLAGRVLARLRIRALKRLMRKLGMTRPILYIWHPAFADMIGRFDERAVVYHCYDEYAAFAGNDRVQVASKDKRLLQEADVVFTVSDGLRRLKAEVNPNTHLVRNGVDYQLFASAQNPDLPVARELQNIPKPVIGCVTRVVPDYFDSDLVRQVFLRRPDWSLVVVGPEGEGNDDRAAQSLLALKALPNVHFLGRRELHDLPSYLKGFDACLIPYVLSENKLLADPLKLYEYLAAGKPVVSKPLPLLGWTGDAVAMADDVDEWVDAIDRQLRTDSPRKIAERQKLARANTWDDRVERISELIASLETKPA